MFALLLYLQILNTLLSKQKQGTWKKGAENKDPFFCTCETRINASCTFFFSFKCMYYTFSIYTLFGVDKLLAWFHFMQVQTQRGAELSPGSSHCKKEKEERLFKNFCYSPISWLFTDIPGDQRQIFFFFLLYNKIGLLHFKMWKSFWIWRQVWVYNTATAVLIPK